MKKQKLLVAKIGGNVIENKKMLDSFLKDFSKIEGYKILVHGGGKLATQLAEKLEIKTEMIDGRRITSADNLDIVVMTYAGLVNKTIVSGLQNHECNALGLTGADANVIIAKKRPKQFVDYGYVGDVIKVDNKILKIFLEQNIMPVFCAVTHDGNGQLLNTNADTVASEIASAMSIDYEVSLYYCFELKGVLENIQDKESVIEHIDLEKYGQLRDNEIIAEGMLPKLQNCFDALQKKVSKVHIANVEFIKDNTTKHTTLSL
ncbi:acetylglutamate kinase [Aquimarina muelleri]|uniref:Acetylglutamate kinase n=1 Tax=Aquimarina muelleri TaxID=279356 RepID=A0A918N3B2_9FLAO|nr:acetylglutamate kinase [Aquimarina muelleri]MCX2763530.1 acetylglutamate kinase [Aquimarina muelleri]GGX25704.1 acetylglutamate kinase [Aquimarina muelleri]